MDDRATPEPGPGVRAVVTGPVGSARLVGPGQEPDGAAEADPTAEADPAVQPARLPGAAMPSPVPDPDEDQKPHQEARPNATGHQSEG